MVFDVTVFADEAGALHVNDKQKNFCFVSGFMAETDSWLAFSADWNEACDRLIPGDEHGRHIFHATEFFERGRNRLRAPRYREWTPEQDDQLLEELIGVIHKHPIEKVGGGVDVGAFRSCTVGERMFLTGARFENGRFQTRGHPERPYFVGFHSIIWQALTHTVKDSLVHFVFGLNHDHIRWSEELYRDLAMLNERLGYAPKYGRIAFSTPEAEPALQAADLRSHLWDQILERAVEVSPKRLEAAKYLEGFTRQHPLYDAEHLEKALAGLPPEQRAYLRAYRK